jgi:hypothetical protein
MANNATYFSDEAIAAREPDVVFGLRNGPCVVEYRDWNYHQWPVRRAFACIGCKYLTHDARYDTVYCNHPLFLEKYKSQQSVANSMWYRKHLRTVHPSSCPVLTCAGAADHPTLPAEDVIPGKQSMRLYRSEEEIFRIPQKLPYWLVDAYAGQPAHEVDQHIVTY